MKYNCNGAVQCRHKAHYISIGQIIFAENLFFSQRHQFQPCYKSFLKVHLKYTFRIRENKSVIRFLFSLNIKYISAYYILSSVQCYIIYTYIANFFFFFF